VAATALLIHPAYQAIATAGDGTQGREMTA
jgi:hypothetical protein